MLPQVMELYSGVDPDFVFYEVLVQEFSDGYFESSNVVAAPADAIGVPGRTVTSAAIAFVRAFWAKPPSGAETTRLSFREGVMWYSSESHRTAHPQISAAKAQLSATPPVWAYGANSNPNGVYPESSTSGELPLQAPAHAVAIWGETAEQVDADDRAAAATEIPDAGGGGDGGGGGGGAGLGLFAGVGAAVAVFLVAIAAAAFVLKKRRTAAQGQQKNVVSQPGVPPSNPSGSLHPDRFSVEDEEVVNIPQVGAPKGAASGGRGLDVVGKRPSHRGGSADATTVEPLGVASGGGGSGSTREANGSIRKVLSQGTLAHSSGGGGGSGMDSALFSPGFVTAGSSGAGSAVRGKVAAAVQELQGALQEELQEDQLQLFGVVGRGGYGTVYHGAAFPCQPQHMHYMHVIASCGCMAAQRIESSAEALPWWAGACMGRMHRVCAGEWRGLDVAIKTVIFQSCGGDQQTAVVATEAAIATNLVHRNIVATYSHDVLDVAAGVGPELGVYKFYLIQVRPTQPACVRAACML